MKFRNWFFFISLLCFQLSAAGAGSASLPRSVPEQEGVDSHGISAFLQVAETNRHEFHSLMVVRHGKVVAEGWWNPYRADLKHTMYSVSKSFTSTAVGFAVSEKKLKVDDKVISFFPEYRSTNAYVADLTVKDLLTMSVGQEPDPTGKVGGTLVWEKTFFETPILHKPGTTFLYNSAGSYMLSAIVTKVTGQTVADYLKPRLFDPLGITGFDWETNPEGKNSGGWGLRIKTEDMAKFGQLLLQKGMWKGKQVLPKEWVEEATTAKIQQSPNATEEQKAKNDWIQGYGYQFWRCRHNAFRADGAFGQYIIVMPEKDAVVAITSETKDMQGIMNMVWDHILPALHDGELPQNEEAVAALQQKLKALALPMPSKGVASSLESSVSGKRYAISENDRKLKSVQFQFKQNQCSATLEYEDASYTLPFGASGWAFSESTRSGPNLVHAKNTLKGLPPFKIASAYRWASDNTLELTLRYIESPHTETLLAIFDGERVALELKNSIDPKPAALEGKQK